MKTYLLLLALTLAVTAQSSFAQNSIKIFDATPIDVSVDLQTRVFATRQIYLSCPAKGPVEATISGPNGGTFVVDNGLMINREWAGGKNVFWAGLLGDPMFYVGEPMETVYLGVQPLDVSRQIKSDGLYTFEMLDWSYTFGNTDIYLNTNCSIQSTSFTSDPVDSTTICHRNMGSSGPRTLKVGANAVSAHLAHGDTTGPCSE
jgi:hypothetical protein